MIRGCGLRGTRPPHKVCRPQCTGHDRPLGNQQTDGRAGDTHRTHRHSQACKVESTPRLTPAGTRGIGGPKDTAAPTGSHDESQGSHVPAALPDAGTPSLTPTGAAAQRQPALPTLSAPSAASRELREPARGFTIRPAPGADIGSGAALSLLAPCQGRACPRTSGRAPGRPIRPFPRRMTGDGTLLGPPCQPQRTGCPGDACTQRATTHAAPSAQTCGHLLLLGHRTTAPETQCHSRGKPRVSAHTPRARGVFTTSNTG